MPIPDHLGIKLDPVALNVSVAPFIPPFDAIDFSHFVVIVQAHDDFADDDIQTGA